jgi:phosphate-selective porin OprO/OprP
MANLLKTAVAALLLSCMPGLALAQSATTSAAAPPSAAQPAVPSAATAAWQDGFFIQSANGDYRLQIGLLAHADGRFAFDDSANAITDTFLFRRLRPNLRGRLARRFEFYFNPDVAGGTLVLQDAYFDTIFAPVFRIRVGKGKTPFGLERLHPGSNLTFFDRALPTALVPNRDIGIQVLGDVSSGLVTYLAGVMNGVADGASADIDINDGKDVAGRLLVRPFAHAKGSRLAGLGVGIAGTRGKQSGAGALPSFRTPEMLQPFFQYGNAVADGVRTRYSPQGFYYYKAFGGFAEYVHTKMPVRKGTVRNAVEHQAWQIAGSYVITGEAATDSSAGVKPKANFDVSRGHLGAFQIVARYHVLSVDESALLFDLAAPGSSRKAEAWTAGINWYLTPNFRYVVNVERTVFDDDASGPRKAENGLAFRAQVNF